MSSPVFYAVPLSTGVDAGTFVTVIDVPAHAHFWKFNCDGEYSSLSLH